MKIKYNKAGLAIRISTLVFGLGLAGFGIASAIGQVMAAGGDPLTTTGYPYQEAMRKRGSGEYTGAFEASYSKGIVTRNPNSNIAANKATFSSQSSNNSNCSLAANPNIKNNSNYFCGSNHTRDTKYYTRYYNAAIQDNEWLDIVEYDWNNINGTLYLRNLANAGISSDEGSSAKNVKTYIYRELHFYKAGTNDEVNFKGIISFNDFDWGEGYAISKNNLHRGYVLVDSNDKTPLVHPDSNIWVMSGKNSTNEITSKYDGKYVLWAEVDSGPNNPLTLTYIIPKLRRGSKNITPFSTVTYVLNGSKPSDLEYNTYDVVANNGTLNPTQPNWSDKTNYEFRGWYTDSAMTKQASSSMTVTANQTLYGKMVKVSASETKASVTTSINNGVITPGATDIDEGDNYMVGYACNNGYTLSSVTVNGTPLSSLAGHTNSYTFVNISGSNTINVECVVSTDPTPDDDDDDDDIDDNTPSIITSIENGTITDSITEYVDAGETYDIEYSCNEGFHIASIKVDDEDVAIDDYKTSYPFTNVSKKRTIAVVCTDAKAPNTGSIISGSYGEDGTAGGSLNIAAILVSSLVSVTGIALIYRFVKRSSAYSFKK